MFLLTRLGKVFIPQFYLISNLKDMGIECDIEEIQDVFDTDDDSLSYISHWLINWINEYNERDSKTRLIIMS
jgi:hypothetical protein